MIENKIKLVAFDWNGTILSDTNAVVRTETHVLKQYGLPPTNLKQFQEVYDIPIGLYWTKMGIDEELFKKDADKIYKLFIDFYEPQEKVCRTRSGAKEIFQYLKQEGIGIVIFSNHPQGHIVRQLERLKLNTYVAQVFGRGQSDNSHMHERSKGAKLNAYVMSEQINPDSVITVGDTIEEIDVAREYGFKSVSLTGGYQSERRLRNANPDYLIHNLVQLKDIISQINGRIT